MGILDAPYPLDLTDEEIAAGFEVQEAPSGVRAIVRDLENGLRVVKTRVSGTVHYVVCDAECAPLYPPSKTLDEVAQRFGKPALAPKRRGARGDDPDIVLLLDNLVLVARTLAQLSPSDDTRALAARTAACKALIETWWQLPPSAEQRAAVRREVLALKDASGHLQAKGRLPSKLATVRPALLQSTVLALNAAGAPIVADQLRLQIAVRQSVDPVTWQAFLESEATFVLFANGTLGLIPRDVPGGEKAMNAAQYEVVRLTRIARKALAVREVVMLLRHHGHAAASWDVALLRKVLALEARLQVIGDNVSLRDPDDVRR
jgi:hypothetical protein